MPYNTDDRACSSPRLRTAVALGSVALALAVGGLPASAYAGGLSLLGFGGSTAGVAYAGAAASTGDATTLFYNPAGLGELERTQVAISSDLLHFTAGPFKDAGSTDAVGAPLTGGDGGDPPGGSIPSLAFALIDEDLPIRLGFAVNAPFGQRTRYPDSWAGRYFATTSELATMKLNLSGSLQVNDWLTLGAGLNAVRARFTLANAIDFGGLCLGLAGPLCPGLGLLPQRADGYGKVKVTGWGFGYTLGVVLEPAERTRIGIAYQSKVNADLEGPATFDVPAAAQVLTGAGGLFRNTSAKANVTFPDSLVFGLSQGLAPDWTLLAGATWTNSSLLKKLQLDFNNPAQPTATIPADWSDAWFASAGVAYRARERLSLRAGLAYDESPIPDSTRSPRVPGTDAIIYAAGAGYDLNDSVTIDVALQYATYDKAHIALEEPGAGALKGSFENDLLVTSLQLSVRF